MGRDGYQKLTHDYGFGGVFENINNSLTMMTQESRTNFQKKKPNFFNLSSIMI